MHEFAKTELKPGQVFDKDLAVRWFKANFPKIKSNTVQMHVDGMAANSRSRIHHVSIRPGSGHDLFYKVGRSQYRLWDPAHDGAPIYHGDKASQLRPAASGEDADEEREEALADTAGVESPSREFGAEADLRNYLEKNISALEPGLTLHEEEGLRAIEYPAGNGRRIDILARGADGAFVVVELKVSRGYDRVIGQIMRYMAWVKANLAEDKPVRGIIVANNISEDLKLATSLISGVRLVEYELHFRLKPIG
jgi:hypothetical protein